MNKDLISRQDAIKEVSKYVHSIDMIIGNGTLSMAGCRDTAEEILEGLPSMEPEPKWIPCSDRLPETCGAYLVQDVCGGIFVDYWRGYWLAKTTMVAWRELPEPYRGGVILNEDD